MKMLFVLAAIMLVAGSGAFAQVPDSLAAATDSLTIEIDTVKAVQYTKKELKRMHRDSVWNYKDSVLRNTPRLLHTYVFDDTTKFKRMFLWNADTWFNKPVSIRPDTTFHDWFTEQPHQRYDAGANYLGVSGSAMQYNNWFMRPELKVFPFFDYYLPYSYTPETMPFYNTKTPYTELAYWGTLFANNLVDLLRYFEQDLKHLEDK